MNALDSRDSNMTTLQDQINNVNKDIIKDEIINYMYPNTKTGYGQYYDINQHYPLKKDDNSSNLSNNDNKNDIHDDNNSYENSDNNTYGDNQNDIVFNKKINTNINDNEIKKLTDDIAKNMDNICEGFTKDVAKEIYENNNKNKNTILGSDIHFDMLIFFIIYLIMSLPTVQLFFGKYITLLNPNPDTYNVPLGGAIIYGMIICLIYYIIKKIAIPAYNNKFVKNK